jgi:pimeloyl-ACP methyl ester carboxylesterase
MNDYASAVLPPRDSPLGFRSWAREMAHAIAWSIKPPAFPSEALPRGDGDTVLLIPGFLTGDWTMSRLRRFLLSLGYRVEISGLALNLGPTHGLIARLDARLMNLAERDGPICVIGQSLGGVLARNLARHHPHAVRSVITLCTPVRFPVTTPLEPFARLLSPLHDPAWVAQRHTIAAPLCVPVTAIYSETDGIVDWRQCLLDAAPGQENLRVDGAHSVMGSNPGAQRAIAHALARRGV